MKTVIVELTDQAFAAMELSTYGEALTATDVINRALLVYASLGPQLSGRIVALRNTDGTIWKRVKVL